LEGKPLKYAKVNEWGRGSPLPAPACQCKSDWTSASGSHIRNYRKLFYKCHRIWAETTGVFLYIKVAPQRRTSKGKASAHAQRISDSQGSHSLAQSRNATYTSKTRTCTSETKRLAKHAICKVFSVGSGGRVGGMLSRFCGRAFHTCPQRQRLPIFTHVSHNIWRDGLNCVMVTDVCNDAGMLHNSVPRKRMATIQ